MTTNTAADEPFQEGFVAVALLRLLSPRFPFPAQCVVGCLPELFAYQSRMFTGVIFTAMPNDAFVNGVRDDHLDLVRNETLPSHHHFVTTTALNSTLGSMYAFSIQARCNFRGAAKFFAQFKDAPRYRGFLRIETDLFRVRIVGVTKRGPSAVPHSLLGPFGDFVLHPFCNHLALELAEGEQHIEHECPHRGAGVKALGSRNKVDSVLVEDLPELIKVGQIPRNTVELIGDNYVDLTGFHLLKEGLNARSFEVFP